MTQNVEVVVAATGERAVRAALGAAPWARLTTRPSRRAAMVVDCVERLDSPDARRDLEWAWRRAVEAAQRLPFVLLMTPGQGKSYVSGLLLQSLVHWSHVAGDELYVAADTDAVRRMGLARRCRAQQELIASAAVEAGRLIVWSCEPRRYEVGFADIPVLAALPSGARGSFTVSASGSRIHWEQGDVDLNLDTVREYVDPKVRQRHEALRRREGARYADAIRQLRVERGVKQSEIAGMSERQVRRLEKGDTTPQSGTLNKLASAHGMTVERYLAELARRSASAPRRKSPTKRTARLH